MSRQLGKQAIRSRYFENHGYLDEHWDELSAEHQGRFVVIAGGGEIARAFDTKREATDFCAALKDPLERPSAITWFFDAHVARRACIG